MMFWIGLAVAFVSSSLGLLPFRDPIRAWRRERHTDKVAADVDKGTDRRVDIVRFMALVIGLFVAGWGYLRKQNEAATEKAARAELRKQLDAARESVKPRRLREPERQLLMETIKLAGCPSRITIHHDSTDHEARVYAADFKEAFLAAGCSANLNNEIGGLRPDLTGLNIAVARARLVPGRTTVPQDAAKVMTALKAAGITYRVGTLPNMQSEDFGLVVGAKPAVLDTELPSNAAP
jgi:hypothetical protein